MKTVASLFHFPVIPFIFVTLIVVIVFVTRGNYKLTEKIMLISSLFFFAYIVSAVRAKPDWGLALSNLGFPHGVPFTPTYIKDYIVIGLGVLGTTITPWGQFFISSFAFDKKIDKSKLFFSQLETYWGAFLTDFFSFFMIVATAATLFVHSIPLVSGEQAALAIRPFAGDLASYLFAFGIFNAGFIGIVTISLSTAYAFSEFFGLSGSLDSSFAKSKMFYGVFLFQLAIAVIFVFFPSGTLFNLAVASQIINAMLLPLIFFYLIRFTDNKLLMGENANTSFQSTFTKVASVIIVIASVFTVITTFIKF
jgi:Mn2+/Fe2+ NRAMP family transporter